MCCCEHPSAELRNVDLVLVNSDWWCGIAEIITTGSTMYLVVLHHSVHHHSVHRKNLVLLLDTNTLAMKTALQEQDTK